VPPSVVLQAPLRKGAQAGGSQRRRSKLAVGRSSSADGIKLSKVRVLNDPR
jgi:hypothetical protein